MSLRWVEESAPRFQNVQGINILIEAELYPFFFIKIWTHSAAHIPNLRTVVHIHFNSFLRDIYRHQGVITYFELGSKVQLTMSQEQSGLVKEVSLPKGHGGLHRVWRCISTHSGAWYLMVLHNPLHSSAIFTLCRPLMWPLDMALLWTPVIWHSGAKEQNCKFLPGT
jgi:hypothetical protein